MKENPKKLVLHVDVDAFFASVEQLLIPALRRRPVVVGSGCIASCSYEARRFGLHAGMSLREAVRRCPHVVILAGAYPIYRCFAEQVWDICRRYTCRLETFLDEAYGQAGGMTGLYGDPMTMGRRLQRQVAGEVGLPVSVGLADNRMLAKLAAGSVKPRGVRWIPRSQASSFLAPLPIEKLPGVGAKTAEILRDVNIRTVGELRVLSAEMLRSMFGRRGLALYERCRGRCEGPDPLPGKAPKTISRETTFHKPTCDRSEIRGMLFYLLERAMRTARGKGLVAGRIELAIRYDDGKHLAAVQSLDDGAGAAENEVFAVLVEMLGRLFRRRVALRSAGIVLSGFRLDGGQRTLFEPPKRTRSRDLSRTLDAIRSRWGHGAIVQGQSIGLLGKLDRNDYGFVLRTPSLTK